MKTSFLLAIAFGVVTVVSVFIIWSVLSAAGVWDSINQTVQDVVGGEDASTWDIEKYVGMSRVMGFTMLVAVVDVILITAIATLAAFLYNMSAALLGGRRAHPRGGRALTIAPGVLSGRSTVG